MTIEIEDMNSSGSPFGQFGELKEMDNEESSEGNQSSKHASPYKLDIPKLESIDNDDTEKQYEK